MLRGKIKHLAFIMDGNNRWGKSHKITNYFNLYNNGANVIRNLIPYIADLDISYTSFFALSTENTENRSKPVVESIIKLLNFHLNQSEQFLYKYNFKITFIGDLKKLDVQTVNNINQISSVNKHANKNLVIAFNYGGKSEIIDACNQLLKSGKNYIHETEFHQFLYCPALPQVDLVIRTGGEYRLSNFLPWHTAYSELYFTNKLWPDFNGNDLLEAINHFYKRTRKFGGQHD